MLGYGLAPPLRAQIGRVARTVHPQRQQVPHPHQHRVAGALHDQPVECLVGLEVRPQIALGVVAWAFDEFFRVESETESLLVKTKTLPESAWMPDIVDRRLNGMFIIAVLVLVLFYVLVWKTKFGFQLRASGANPGASRVTGVNPKRMVMISMLLSGALAGLVGMRALLGDVHAYQNNLAEQQGFNGIAVALLGRNHPLGIFISALLFGYLGEASGRLQLIDIPKEITTIKTEVCDE